MPTSILRVTGEQIRAARALARMEQLELARRAGVSLETVKRLERIRGPVDANVRTLIAIATAFRDSGVVFQSEEGAAGCGIRLIGGVPAQPVASSPVSAAPTPSLYRLIYFSTAIGMDAEMLENIRQVAARRNARLDVSGALLATDGRFLQALEGPKAAVLQVYGSIAADPRHKGQQVVSASDTHARFFKGLAMYVGSPTPDHPAFENEPSMANGFRPEMLSAASALGLLGIMCDLGHDAVNDAPAACVA